MTGNVKMIFSSAIFFFVSSCCNYDIINSKIEKLEVKRDSLLTIEDTYKFQRLKDFETLQALTDTSKDYINLSKRISNNNKVSLERETLILKLDKRIIDLEKQKIQANK